ncbi:MAG: hypothetical protein JWO79_1016 [Actinomycetia bacterium]|jgi:hypothetical protein|nr:hypothetical protein [Actinomycetes bacterium]MDQ1656840.1 hypothetical protein [Cryptosporangiaceae bacterium]
MKRSSTTIAHRFRGPSRSGNGGYTSGVLADALLSLTGDGVATVTLRIPPPLDTALETVPFNGGIQLWHRAKLVADAVPGSFTGPVADPVPFDVASEAAARYPGLVAHPFPSCFVCGPARPDGDGLRLFPGPVPRRDRTVAASWIPTRAGADQSGTLSRAVAWAALDCPGGWSLDLVGRPMVLGRITAQVDAVPRLGGRYVVVGHARDLQGRKAFTDSALYSTDGTLMARAEATWIAVDPEAFNEAQPSS